MSDPLCILLPMRKHTTTPTILSVAREARHAEVVAALRDGRKQRAVRFTDRRKEASRKACRGRHY
jgi:hypothetical protein